MNEDLREIKEREEAATPGPWWGESGVIHAPYPGRPGSAVHPASVPYVQACLSGTEAEQQQALADEDFIAEARADIPALIAKLEAVRAVLAPLLEDPLYGRNKGYFTGECLFCHATPPELRKGGYAGRLELSDHKHGCPVLKRSELLGEVV